MVKPKQQDTTIAENRKARHNYEIFHTYECGIVLLGTEIKSLKARHVNFGDAYALVKNGEVFLLGLKIEPWAFGTHENHEPLRTRKLLLNKEEIKRITKEIHQKGLTVVPLKIYLKNGKAKVLVGVAKGKTKMDKRETVKSREADREVARVMRRGEKG